MGINISFKILRGHVDNDIRCCVTGASSLLVGRSVPMVANCTRVLGGMNGARGENFRISLSAMGIGAGSFA